MASLQCLSSKRPLFLSQEPLLQQRPQLVMRAAARLRTVLLRSMSFTQPSRYMMIYNDIRRIPFNEALPLRKQLASFSFSGTTDGSAPKASRLWSKREANTFPKRFQEISRHLQLESQLLAVESERIHLVLPRMAGNEVAWALNCSACRFNSLQFT